MRWLALGAVLVMAVTLRFAALDFGGHDFEARPDENGIVVTVLALDRGEFFPPVLLYGGGYFEPLRAFMRAWHAACGGGMAERVAEGDLGGVRVVARAWSALLAVVTVVIVYLVGRAVRDERTGVLAAALLAALPLAVREAHFAKADSAAAFAGAVVMAALVFARGPAWRRGALVGAATALALATKALVSVLPAVVVGLAWPPSPRRSRMPEWRALCWAAVACFAGVLLLDAPLLRHFDEVRALAPAVFRPVGDATWLPGGAAAPSPLVYHATVSLRWGCGLAVTLLAAPAVAYGLYAGGSLGLLALLVLAHGVAVAASPAVLARYVLPALPPLVVLVAAMAVAAVDRLTVAGPGRALALAAIAVALLTEPVAASVGLVRLLGQADTRSLAGRWIAAHVPRDGRIVSWGSPTPASDYGRPPTAGRAVRQSLAPAEWNGAGTPPTYVVWHHHPLPYSSEALPADRPRLRSLAVFDPFGDPRAGSAVFEPLDAFYVPLGRMAGVARPGPRIEIFAVEPGVVD